MLKLFASKSKAHLLTIVCFWVKVFRFFEQKNPQPPVPGFKNFSLTHLY